MGSNDEEIKYCSHLLFYKFGREVFVHIKQLNKFSESILICLFDSVLRISSVICGGLDYPMVGISCDYCIYF